jgi:putative holliday junction resolvase
LRVLALDLGTKRVGVAVSDASATLASPLTTVQRSGDRVVDHSSIARLVEEEDVVVVVVGLPLNMDGSRGPAARSAEAEANALAGALAVPVELADERLTTVSANRVLIGHGKRAPARRQVVDRTAAAVLLQAWLDGPRGRALRQAGTPAGGGGSAGGDGGSVPG